MGEMTPPWGNASFKLTFYGCVVSVYCICFAYLDVVCDELYDWSWNGWSVAAFSVCMFIVSKSFLISSVEYCMGMFGILALM